MPNPGPLPPYLSVPFFLLGTDGAWLRRRWQGVPFSASLGYTRSSSSSVALLSLLQVASDDDSLPLVPLEPHGSQLLSTTLHIVGKPKLLGGIVSHPSWVTEDKGWALDTHWCPTHWGGLASLDSLVASHFSASLPWFPQRSMQRRLPSVGI